MAGNFKWKIYEQHIEWLGRTWHRDRKGTTVMIGYLIFLAVIVLFSLVWNDEPARAAGPSASKGTTQRAENLKLNHSLEA